MSGIGSLRWESLRTEDAAAWADEAAAAETAAQTGEQYQSTSPKITRLRGLCGCECPCLLDLTDFCVGWLDWAGAHKSGGDEGLA
jgi:hypothetical protein